MSTNAHNPETVLVTGGNGKTGRRVADRLTALGVPVRIGSRGGRPPFDWADRATWGPVLRGVHSVYLAYYPDLAVPGATDVIRSFAGLAAQSGVRRIVLLSGRGEEEAQRCEQAVREAGTQWTVLRASWFNQNFTEGYLRGPVLSGEVVLPAGGTAEPFLDADDIADVAVAALTGDGHAGQVYELTGPRLLTFADAVAEIAKATGRDLRFVPVTGEQYAAALAEHGVPADVTALLGYLFAEVLDGRNAHLGDGVRRALGREPRDFADFARDSAATGAWDG